MIDLLERFQVPLIPGDEWPTKPATFGNLIRDAIRNGWLESAVPFGRTLSGPETVWKEALQLTAAGRKAIGQ